MGFTCELSQLRVYVISVTGYVVVICWTLSSVLGGASGDLGCGMNQVVKSKAYSRRSAGTLLLVGVLAGVTIGGGVGVLAASSTKSVTVCANKKNKCVALCQEW